MSDVTRAFIKSLGRPNPRLASGLHFNDPLKQVLWEKVYAESAPAGSSIARLCSAPVSERLQPCLDAWRDRPPGHPVA